MRLAVMTLAALSLAIAPGLAQEALGGELGSYIDAKADYIQLVPERDTAIYSGTVQITYQDAVITAGKAVVETSNYQAVFTDDVRIRWQDHVVEAVWVWIDFQNNLYKAKNCRLELPPQFFGNDVYEPLYVWGHVVEGDLEELVIHDAFVSPCDRYRDLHLGIEAHRVRVYRKGKRLQTSAAKVKAHNATILWLPGFSVRTRYFTKGDIIPNFGNNTYEGLWGEVRWYYNANGAWDIRVTQNQGVDIQHDYDYALGNSGDGHSTVTYDTGTKRFTGSLRHNQRIGDSTRFGGNFDLRQNSSLAGGSSFSQTTSFNVSRNVGRSRLQANLNNTTTTTTETRSNSSATATISHDLWGSRQHQARVQVSTRYSSFDQGALGRNTELDTSAEFSQPTNLADFDLYYDKRTDLDGNAFTGDDNFSSLDRLPELVVNSDLRDWGVEAFTGRAELSLARWVESPTDVDRRRMSLGLSGSMKPIQNLVPNTSISFSSDFTQRITARDEAIYTLGAQSTLRTKLGDFASFNAGWSWRTFKGFTPFRRDFASKQHTVRGGFDFEPDRYTRANVSTSYDIERDRWSDIRMSLSRNRGLSRFSASTSYDIENQRWRNLNLRYSLTSIDRFYVDVSALYDLDQKQLSTVSSQLDLALHDDWRLEWLGRYDGRRKEFSSNEFRLTWEHHDFFASVSYDVPRDEFLFGIALKAFPTFQPDSAFGIGQSGERIDPTLPSGGGF